MLTCYACTKTNLPTPWCKICVFVLWEAERWKRWTTSSVEFWRKKLLKKNSFWIWRLHERRVWIREIKFWSKGLKSERVTSQNWHPTADKIETAWCKHIVSASVSVRHAIVTHPFKFKRWIGCMIHYITGVALEVEALIYRGSISLSLFPSFGKSLSAKRQQSPRLRFVRTRNRITCKSLLPHSIFHASEAAISNTSSSVLRMTQS